MNRIRNLHVEHLESRELLSGAHAARAHAARAHAAPAAAAAPLVLDGTLTVNNRAASTDTNLSGGYTTSAPVSGQLGGLGKVRGYWVESSDGFGNYMGPDTITLRGAQGSVTVSFNDGTPGPAHRRGHTVYYQHAQHARGGSGAYAGATEAGTIDVNMNAAHTTVVSLTLQGQGS